MVIKLSSIIELEGRRSFILDFQISMGDTMAVMSASRSACNSLCGCLSSGPVKDHDDNGQEESSVVGARDALDTLN